MTAGSLFFALSALLSLAGAIMVVASRSPIRSAVGLLAAILGIAGLYLRLSAQFLAAIQVIVYAGAVVVLFVFVIMLLGADWLGPREAGRTRFARTLSGVLAASIAGAVMVLLARAGGESSAFGPAELGHGSAEAVGSLLFTQAVAPFELATALLIVAAIGAVAVARNRRPPPHPTGPTQPQAMFGGPLHPRDAQRPLPDKERV